MKRVLLLLMMFGLMVAFTFGQSITVTSPTAGSYSQTDTLRIVWEASGITGNVKINLRKADGSGGITITESYPVNDSPYNYSLSSVPAGDYFVKIKQGAVSGRTDVFTVTVAGGQSISVSSPNNSFYTRGVNSLHIDWTSSGITGNVKVTLRKADGSGGTVIRENVPYNSSSFEWAIPANTETGDYFVKVKQGEVFGVSRQFKILKKISVPGTMYVRQDLEIRDIHYIYNRGGWIVARLKSNVNNFNGDVSFGLIFPEMGRDGSQNVIKRVNLLRGRSTDIYLWRKSAREFTKSGVLIRVNVDNNRRINETNEHNNSMQKRITIYDLSFAESPRRSLSLKRMYFKGKEDYRLQFDIKVNHNFVKPLRNVNIKYSITGHGVRLIDIPHIFRTIGNGEVALLHINRTFGRFGRLYSKVPKFKKGERYLVEITIDPHNVFKETNERNNVVYFSFKVTK